MLVACGLLAPTEGSLFSYFIWQPADTRQLLYSLTPEHKTALWRCFLHDGQQPLEFEWVWEPYYSGEPVFLLEWELTLRMVLADLGLQIQRSAATF